MNLFPLIILLIFLVSCGSSQNDTKNNDLDIDELLELNDTCKYAIFDSPMDSLPFTSNILEFYTDSSGSRITLDESELNQIEKSVKKFVDQFSEDSLLLVYSEYDFQYLPGLNEKGEKIVWVNGLCNSYCEELENHLIQVWDGGICYFNLYINLENNLIESIEINGRA